MKISTSAVVVAALLLSGCASTQTPPAPVDANEQPASSARTIVESCGDDSPESTGRWIGARDAWFEAAEAGSGDTVVVFANQAESEYCGWVPFAASLGELGIRSIFVNFCFVGQTVCPEDAGEIDYAADALLAAAALAREEGATRVVLVGASMGGCSTIAAAARAGDSGTIDAAADLSGPLAYKGFDTLPLAGDITVPLLLATASNDTAVSPPELETLKSASGSSSVTISSGLGHGWDMLVDRTLSPSELALELTAFIQG